MGVDARLAQACAKVMSNTCSGFFYTLWSNHSEMNFSFGGEAVEEVKRYAAEAAKGAKASTPLNSSEVVPPAANAEVQPAEVAEV